MFQPDNAVPIGTFIDSMDDRELMDILPVLLAVEAVDDVRQARPTLTLPAPAATGHPHSVLGSTYGVPPK